jgi:hypothetical protein
MDAYLEDYDDPEILAPLILAVLTGNRPPQYIVESRSWSWSRSGSLARAWSRSRSWSVSWSVSRSGSRSWTRSWLMLGIST